ncbi:hypothetical protein [uncultured Stenotrophomonas sp.]|uniref:hypothetical protein n=1 Tax=uncultured Stenotrophomonas sp. TaxID=165438 RepID=UPI0025F75BC1|nr:hypothetical protein [uncultured Stenotrophomonas sp.]
MSPDLIEKLILACFSVVAGLLLGQWAAHRKETRHRKRLVKLLHEELGELKRDVERLINYYHKALFLYGAGQAERVGISQLVNPVYEGYYKDALLNLNSEQRSSFHRIHSNSKIQNSYIDQINTIVESMDKEPQLEEGSDVIPASLERLGGHYGLALRSAYSNCHVIKWHVDHHLRNIDNPALPMDKAGILKYNNFLKEVAEEIEAVISMGGREAEG